ncbi:hypothetical protein LRP67_06730 [Nocardioides sp. cx-169]|uniref:hypothetical protein n=1 Tax=Nocardioides sp. cx-169 TaxID=2899080 RepID=UPI001E4D7E72|nr:hypothetical protein [Nocardioides sp. cx-169]MCD4533773.1 hypothetical protein [Nocardioides sp. cx-169]
MRVALVPGVPALLPSYRGIEDPVADLRAACLDAVRWLGAGFGVHGSLQGLNVARCLAEEAGVAVDLRREHPGSVLVVANGSATRSEKAPGHLDERAAGFDEGLRAALLAGRAGDVDESLARELWADVASLVWLGREIEVDPDSVRVDYDDDPYGVQYWVMRMEGVWR